MFNSIIVSLFPLLYLTSHEVDQGWVGTEEAKARDDLKHNYIFLEFGVKLLMGMSLIRKLGVRGWRSISSTVIACSCSNSSSYSYARYKLHLYRKHSM